MARRVKVDNNVDDISSTPDLTVEARENRIISLALDEAEKRIRNGTASDSLLNHFLKLGSTKDQIEKEILARQKELIHAKTVNLQSSQRVEELYINALEAMKNYSGYMKDRGDD